MPGVCSFDKNFENSFFFTFVSLMPNNTIHQKTRETDSILLHEPVHIQQTTLYTNLRNVFLEYLLVLCIV